MLKRLFKLTAAACFVCWVSCACDQSQAQTPNRDNQATQEPASAKPLIERVLTKQERDKLTPDDVLTMIKEGKASRSSIPHESGHNTSGTQRMDNPRSNTRSSKLQRWSPFAHICASYGLGS